MYTSTMAMHICSNGSRSYSNKMNLNNRIATHPIPAKVSVHYAQALPFLKVVIPEPSLATIPDSLLIRYTIPINV